MTVLAQPKRPRDRRRHESIDWSGFEYPKPERIEEPDYRRWLRDLGYCALTNFDKPCGGIPGRDRIEAAHLLHGAGRGTKGPDFTCINLCPRHHDVYDAETLPWQIVAFLWQRAIYARERFRVEKERKRR